MSTDRQRGAASGHRGLPPAVAGNVQALPQFESAIAALQEQPTTLAGARVRLAACLAASDPVRAAQELDVALPWFAAHAPRHPDRARAEELRKSL